MSSCNPTWPFALKSEARRVCAPLCGAGPAEGHDRGTVPDR